MDGYQILRKGVTATVKYGTAVAAGIGTGLLRYVNDNLVVKRWKRNDKPHKRPLEDAAMDIAFAFGGLVIGDKLADKVGKEMDELHDMIVKTFKPKQDEEPKQEDKPIDVEFTEL